MTDGRILGQSIKYILSTHFLRSHLPAQCGDRVNRSEYILLRMWLMVGTKGLVYLMGRDGMKHMTLWYSYIEFCSDFEYVVHSWTSILWATHFSDLCTRKRARFEQSYSWQSSNMIPERRQWRRRKNATNPKWFLRVLVPCLQDLNTSTFFSEQVNPILGRCRNGLLAYGWTIVYGVVRLALPFNRQRKPSSSSTE